MKKFLEMLNQQSVLIILTSSVIIGFINGVIVALNHINRLK